MIGMHLFQKDRGRVVARCVRFDGDTPKRLNPNNLKSKYWLIFAFTALLKRSVFESVKYHKAKHSTLI